MIYVKRKKKTQRKWPISWYRDAFWNHCYNREFFKTSFLRTREMDDDFIFIIVPKGTDRVHKLEMGRQMDFWSMIYIRKISKEYKRKVDKLNVKCSSWTSLLSIVIGLIWIQWIFQLRTQTIATGDTFFFFDTIIWLNLKILIIVPDCIFCQVLFNNSNTFQSRYVIKLKYESLHISKQYGKFHDVWNMNK